MLTSIRNLNSGFFTKYKMYIYGVIILMSLYLIYRFYYKSEEPITKQNSKNNQSTNQYLSEIDEDNDNYDSSDINKELAKIKNEENLNVSCHNLTNSEIEDINTKLNLIQPKDKN